MKYKFILFLAVYLKAQIIADIHFIRNQSPEPPQPLS